MPLVWEDLPVSLEQLEESAQQDPEVDPDHKVHPVREEMLDRQAQMVVQAKEVPPGHKVETVPPDGPAQLEQEEIKDQKAQGVKLEPLEMLDLLDVKEIEDSMVPSAELVTLERKVPEDEPVPQDVREAPVPPVAQVWMAVQEELALLDPKVEVDPLDPEDS